LETTENVHSCIQEQQEGGRALEHRSVRGSRERANSEWEMIVRLRVHHSWSGMNKRFTCI